jgi:hypothetical protein
MATRVGTADAGAAPITGAALPEGAPSLPPRISWGAVLSGALVAITVGAMLNVLGAAIGANTLEPAAPGASPSASAFGIGAGIWLAVSNLIGLAVGGYVAARLSGTADGTDGILHGLSVWALSFLVSAVLLTNIVSGTVRTAASGVSSLASGLSSTVGGAASAAGGAAANQVNPQAIVERMQGALSGSGGSPAQMNSDQRRAEIGQILTSRVTSGNFDQGARDRLSQLVAAEYNVSPQEANNRITQLEQQAQQTANQAAQTARQAADTAADGAATAAYFIFGAMLLGAIASVLGARAGTRSAVRVASNRYA